METWSLLILRKSQPNKDINKQESIRQNVSAIREVEKVLSRFRGRKKSIWLRSLTRSILFYTHSMPVTVLDVENIKMNKEHPYHQGVYSLVYSRHRAMYFAWNVGNLGQYFRKTKCCHISIGSQSVPCLESVSLCKPRPESGKEPWD